MAYSYIMIRENKIDHATVRDPLELKNASFLKEIGVAFLYLFGSYAESPGPLSDIDLAYESRGILTFDEETELHYRICSYLRTSEVDLVRFGALPVVVRFDIISRGKLAYCEDPGLLADIKEHIYNIYPDAARMTGQYLSDFFHHGNRAG